MFDYSFQVPAQKKIRMIVHTDYKNEADDQYAVAHHLMTPKFAVAGIVAGHFDRANMGRYPEGGTAQASYDEVVKVLEHDRGQNRRSAPCTGRICSANRSRGGWNLHKNHQLLLHL